MKKRLKKLGLHRETVRNLQGDQLGKVAGGACTQEFMTTCVCTDACDSGQSAACPTRAWSCGCPPGCQSDTFEIQSGCASNCTG